jgi:hypothetical protein
MPNLYPPFEKLIRVNIVALPHCRALTSLAAFEIVRLLAKLLKSALKSVRHLALQNACPKSDCDQMPVSGYANGFFGSAGLWDFTKSSICAAESCLARGGSVSLLALGS